MTDTATVSTAATHVTSANLPTPAAPAFIASDLTTQVPEATNLVELVERINALSSALVTARADIAKAKSGELTDEQLSALNKITAFFSV